MMARLMPMLWLKQIAHRVLASLSLIEYRV